jgi:hypothetical protein
MQIEGCAQQGGKSCTLTAIAPVTITKRNTKNFKNIFNNASIVTDLFFKEE